MVMMMFAASVTFRKHLKQDLADLILNILNEVPESNRAGLGHSRQNGLAPKRSISSRQWHCFNAVRGIRPKDPMGTSPE